MLFREKSGLWCVCSRARERERGGERGERERGGLEKRGKEGVRLRDPEVLQTELGEGLGTGLAPSEGRSRHFGEVQ